LQQKAGHRSGKCPGFSPDELRVAFSIPSGSLFLVNHLVFGTAIILWFLTKKTLEMIYFVQYEELRKDLTDLSSLTIVICCFGHLLGNFNATT
jgi:hypothetical protein